MKHFSKWFYLISIPIFIILCLQSSAYGQWKSVTPPTLSGEWTLLDVHFTSANEGWAVGYGAYEGTLLHYKDGNWTLAEPPMHANGSLTGVHFTSAGEGWAVGRSFNQGSLLHYKDDTWTWVAPPTVSANWGLWGVHFTSANEGWAVGYDDENKRAVLLHYQGGEWSSVTSPTFENFNLERVHFTSAGEGWAVGYGNNKGVLLHYQGGEWSSVDPPTVDGIWTLRNVHFTSANEGWAVGNGVLLHYTNGVWSSVTPPVSAGLYGVHFTSANEGWAVGYWGGTPSMVLFHYKSGVWTSVTVDTNPVWVLYGVHFTSANEGWAVGWDPAYPNKGVLFHYILGLSPNEGTIGTQITIVGSDFGDKKGKVLIGGVAAKIAKDGWEYDTVTCSVNRAPSVGIHDVTVKPSGADDISLPSAFTVKLPEIGSLSVYEGRSGAPVTLSGNFFGTKKGKVYLVYEKDGKPKKKNCKITFWSMDTITLEVPKTSKSFPPNIYPLKVENKVGIAVTAPDFTVQP